jgi:hypothetical protein
MTAKKTAARKRPAPKPAAKKAIARPKAAAKAAPAKKSEPKKAAAAAAKPVARKTAPASAKPPVLKATVKKAADAKSLAAAIAPVKAPIPKAQPKKAAKPAAAAKPVLNKPVMARKGAEKSEASHAATVLAPGFDLERRRQLIAAAAARQKKSGSTVRYTAPVIGVIRTAEPPPIERHRFSVGDSVKVVATSGMWFKHGIAYKVTAALPPSGGKLQYRIKNDQEPFERVVTESQLASI